MELQSEGRGEERALGEWLREDEGGSSSGARQRAKAAAFCAAPKPPSAEALAKSKLRWS